VQDGGAVDAKSVTFDHETARVELLAEEVRDVLSRVVDVRLGL
jgi:hypothetical protein